MEMPKTKEEFECIMKSRRHRYDYGAGFCSMILCNPDGSPLRDEDKRAMCEIQKLALGSKTGYMFCGEPQAARNDMDTVTGEEITKGTLIREIFIEMPAEERAAIRPFYVKQVTHIKKKVLLTDGFGPMGPGVTCAFPGGCP